MTITEYNFLKKLKTEKINCSTVPQKVKKSAYFDNLLKNGVIELEGNWRRGSIKLKDEERAYYDEFFSNKFPSEIIQEFDRANNIKSLRNSKARVTESNSIVFLRGTKKVTVNRLEVNLKTHTKDFGLFSTVLESLICSKVCFVENLHTFLNAEKVISEEYVFLHTYGRIGTTLLDKMQLEEALVFSDYDFVGLGEYLKIKEKFKDTTFFVPQNYEYLFEKYSRSLKEKGSETSQKPTRQVQQSTDEVVKKIRTQIYETQFFLEQEIVTLENL